MIKFFKRLVAVSLHGIVVANLMAQTVSGFRDLPAYPPARPEQNLDYLVSRIPENATVYRSDNGVIILTNGLVSRSLTTSPDGCTIGLNLIKNNRSFLRAVKPEAEITIDGNPIRVGGLRGQPVLNYFREEWIDRLNTDSLAMHLNSITTGRIKKRFEWKKRLEWMPEDLPWPPPGIEVIMLYTFEKIQKPAVVARYGDDLSEKLMKLQVKVHYEVYDGIPLISKWITVINNGKTSVTLDHFRSEILAYPEPEASVGDLSDWLKPDITIATDYAFGGGMNQASSQNNSFSWQADSAYRTIINYNRVQPSMLVVEPDIGPGISVGPGTTFDTYRVFELFHDSSDRERKGLETKRMYRTIAPWVTENPILMHVRNADNKAVELAIDQCADIGFQMVIMTFGSGFNLEDNSSENLSRMKYLGQNAHEKGIALGGYSLLASRSIDDANDVVMPEGRKPVFNASPCLQSNWGRQYFRNLYEFYSETGLDVLEHDGSYPGDICISSTHPGHIGREDSQWNQFRIIADFYRWCRARGIYLNVPDWYFLNGSSKTAMGYRETNWSLPRGYQEIIERQNIYDGTWEKTPSMGWMFVPLVQYHGGGAAATIEPLKDHLDHYDQRLANLFGAGVQACFRGPRLYDSPETREVVKKWVDFYNRHRKILNSDIIHYRRPDGRDMDGILHVNPAGKEQGLLMLYNPLDQEITRDITINLYYTGLTGKINVIHEDQAASQAILDHDAKLKLNVRIPSRDCTWYVFTSND